MPAALGNWIRIELQILQKREVMIMKKLVFFVLLMILVISLVGCGKSDKVPSEAIGTWYSTRPDTLTIEDNGVYTSTWMTMAQKGNYTVKDGVLSFKGLDGEVYNFKVVKEGDQKTLYFKSDKSSLTYTYYDTKEKADKIIDQQKVSNQKATEEENNKKLKEVQENLVGTWSGNGTQIEFTSDGKYKFKNYKDNVWQYSIIDAETLEIIKDTDETFKAKIKLTKAETGYELIFDSEKFTKQ